MIILSKKEDFTLPFKGTDKKAYNAARKYPKIFRSLAHKILKNTNKISSNKVSHKDTRITNKATINRVTKNVTNNKSGFQKVVTDRKFKSSLTIVHDFQLSRALNEKIEKLSKQFLRELSEYLFQKAFHISSKSFQITIEVGKIIVCLHKIYLERDNYSLIAEVIAGEIHMDEAYIELEPFIKTHIALFQEIQLLVKNIVIPL